MLLFRFLFSIFPTTTRLGWAESMKSLKEKKKIQITKADRSDISSWKVEAVGGGVGLGWVVVGCVVGGW